MTFEEASAYIASQSAFDARLVAAQNAYDERIAQLEADAHLGRLVRNMPDWYMLEHDGSGGYTEWSAVTADDDSWVWSDTPEGALEAVGVTA